MTIIERFLLSLLTCVLGFGFGAVSPVHASAQPAGWRTSGTQILTPDGTPFVMSGVNWFGFETKYFVAGGLAHRDLAILLDQAKEHGFNTVRRPFSSSPFCFSRAV